MEASGLRTTAAAADDDAPIEPSAAGVSPGSTSPAPRVSGQPIPAGPAASGPTADDETATPLCAGVPGALGTATRWLSLRVIGKRVVGIE